jgi:Fatty acid hydroxylase superfamily
MELIDYLFEWNRFAFYGFAFLGIILARYFAIAGGLHLFFYSAGGDFCSRRAVSISPPSGASIRRDIKLSMCSAVIFALCAAAIVSGYDLGITKLYADIHRYGLWYLGVSYGLVLLLQDTYFYFIHRLFHHPRLFRWFHQGHHKSSHPTPFRLRSARSCHSIAISDGDRLDPPTSLYYCHCGVDNDDRVGGRQSSRTRFIFSSISPPLARAVVYRPSPPFHPSSSVQSALWTIFHVLGSVTRYQRPHLRSGFCDLSKLKK